MMLRKYDVIKMLKYKKCYIVFEKKITIILNIQIQKMWKSSELGDWTGKVNFSCN